LTVGVFEIRVDELDSTQTVANQIVLSNRIETHHRITALSHSLSIYNIYTVYSLYLDYTRHIA
jgi:hypothetical protein